MGNAEMTTNLTQKETAVVRALKERDGGIYSHEIRAYAEGISEAEIGGVVASLVKKGIVYKDSAGKAKEDEYVHLTEAGEDLDLPASPAP